MRNKFFFICLMLLFLLATAKTHIHQKGGISLWVPDDWEVEAEDDLLTADSPEGNAFALLELLDVDSLEAALESYDAALAEEFDDISLAGEPQKTTINGMDAYSVSGSASRDDKPWIMDVALLSTGKGIVLFICSHEKELDKEFAPLCQKIKGSLKKT